MTIRSCPECGTDLPYSAKSCSCGWGKTGKSFPEAPKDYSCAAHGCPLLGSISPSIGPNGTYYCRFHFNTPVKDWPSITQKLRSGETLANERQGKDDYLTYITEKMNKEGMKEFQGNMADYLKGKS